MVIEIFINVPWMWTKWNRCKTRNIQLGISDIFAYQVIRNEEIPVLVQWGLDILFNRPKVLIQIRRSRHPPERHAPTSHTGIKILMGAMFTDVMTEGMSACMN